MGFTFSHNFIYKFILIPVILIIIFIQSDPLYAQAMVSPDLQKQVEQSVRNELDIILGVRLYNPDIEDPVYYSNASFPCYFVGDSSESTYSQMPVSWFVGTDIILPLGISVGLFWKDNLVLEEESYLAGICTSVGYTGNFGGIYGCLLFPMRSSITSTFPLGIIPIISLNMNEIFILKRINGFIQIIDVLENFYSGIKWIYKNLSPLFFFGNGLSILREALSTYLKPSFSVQGINDQFYYSANFSSNINFSTGFFESLSDINSYGISCRFGWKGITGEGIHMLFANGDLETVIGIDSEEIKVELAFISDYYRLCLGYHNLNEQNAYFSISAHICAPVPYFRGVFEPYDEYVSPLRDYS